MPGAGSKLFARRAIFGQKCDKDSTAVATNSRSMIFVTIVSCVRWRVCVFDSIYSGASLSLSMYV